MRFVSNPFRRQDGLFLFIAALSVLLYVRAADGGFPLDDSWIHQVYGRNLAETGQWAFIPGVPSAASTSPLYTVLLSIGYRLGIHYALWTHALGVAALWIAGVVGSRLAERLAPHIWHIGLVAGLSLVFAWHLIWAAASGMETMLFSMGTLVLIAFAWRELDTSDDPPAPPFHRGESRLGGIVRRGIIFGALAALAALTRPEGIMLAGLIGLFMLLVRPHSWKGFLAWSLGAALGFGILIAPYLALNLQLTGGLLPDTAAAKQAENAPLLAVSYPARIINMLFPMIAGGQLLLIPGILYFAIARARLLPTNRRVLFELLPICWALALILLYAARLPAPYQHGRYVIPSLPSLILTGIVGLALWMRQWKPALEHRVVTRSLAISAALAFVYFGLIAGPGVYRQDVRIIDEEMVGSAFWIRKNIPPDQLLAVHDIGALGYFAPRPILDLAGLVSPEIVPFINEEEPLWNWLRERGARYLMAFPDQIPGDDPNDPRLCLVFTTGGKTSPAAGGPNMAVYALVWDGVCP